jgi:hypothetical protein
MADPKVQPPGTGVTDTTPKHEGAGPGEGRPAGPGDGPRGGEPEQDIRPRTLRDGTHVISGPLPARSSGGAGNTAGTPGFGFSFHGQPGGAFSIYGAGFNQYGNVFVGGKQATVTAWNDNRIKGLLPDDVDVDAEVLVVDGTGVAQRGPTKTPVLQGQVQLTHEVGRDELAKIGKPERIKPEGDKPKGALPEGATEARSQPGDAGQPGKK